MNVSTYRHNSSLPTDSSLALRQLWRNKNETDGRIRRMEDILFSKENMTMQRVISFMESFTDDKSPTFTGLTLTGLTASKLVATDADKALTSDTTTLTPVFAGLGIGAAAATDFQVSTNDATITPQVYITNSGDGDASSYYAVTAQGYTVGVDNNDSDLFKIQPGSSLSGNTGFNMTSAGLIGINIVPVTDFQLYTNDATTTPQIYNTNAGAGDASMLFGVTANNWVAGIDNDDGDAFKIQQSSSLSGNTGLNIDTSGNVGIGKLPSSLFEIYSSTAQLRINTKADVTNSASMRFDADRANVDEDVGVINAFNDGATAVAGIRFRRGSNDTSGYMRFDTDNSYRLKLDGDGLKPQGSSTIHAIALTGAPSSTSDGALWLDTDAGGNGHLMCYANGGWRTVATL